ncbi:hypothetical protein MAR_010545, partial [Mya arenaria]
MENAVANLEALKADSDVNNLSQRLKCEFEDNDETVNPAALLPKLEEAKRDYAGLVQQAADIQHAQMEAMTEFRGHLNDVCQLLLTLQSKSGAEMTEKPAELCRLESFLGTSVPWGVPEPDNSLVGSETPGSGGEGSRVSCPGSDISTCSDQKAGVESSGQCRDGDFVPVSETEFESVSSLIRGKVKLADVNSSASPIFLCRTISQSSSTVCTAIMAFTFSSRSRLQRTTSASSASSTISPVLSSSNDTVSANTRLVLLLAGVRLCDVVDGICQPPVRVVVISSPHMHVLDRSLLDQNWCDLVVQSDTLNPERHAHLRAR